MELRDRGVILTGASGGIGSALTAALLQAGAQVLAVGRSAAPLQRLAQAHRSAGARLRCVQADINEAAGRDAILAAAQTLATPPSVLIHAAALSGFGLFEDGSEQEAQRLFQTNVLSPIALTRRLLPLLLQQPEAAVVALGSTFGSIGFPGFATYSSSKFALRGLFEALAREYADTPVRFQWLAPRATDTGFNQAEVVALNRELKTAVDAPAPVAQALLAGLRQGRRRLQLGWPEKLFVRINGLLPRLVDSALRAQLPIIRRHARPAALPVTEGV